MGEVIRNDKGEVIKLNKREQMVANHVERQVNALGYEINITTLTTIIKKVSEQKFFQIAPADYIPLRVGEGAWSSNLVTYRDFVVGDEFETGVINTGSNNGRLSVADVGIDSISVKVINWAKAIGWTLFDLQIASKSGNWDLVAAKEKSRKKNWDLGVQRIAFLGARGDTNMLGLFNQTGVTINTTRITAALNGLTPANLSTFLAGVLDDYRKNCNRSAWPTHFVIPESDYLGLATPSSSSFPLKSMLQLMQETFQTMTGNPNFKILPCAYGDKSYSGASVQYYALYNADDASLRMDIPVDYTATLANSIDNFSFQNVGYGQLTGVMAYRPAEMLYFQF